MIPELDHAHLSEKLTRSNYLLTILLIQVVQSIKEVTLESIATKLAMPIKFESRRKKIQRFLSDDEWDIDDAEVLNDRRKLLKLAEQCIISE